MDSKICLGGKKTANAEMKIDAYAKINTYLEVLERRADGYHELCSHMQLITLHDTLAVRMSGAPADRFSLTLSLMCDRAEVPVGEDNLILKAARAYFATVAAGPCTLKIDFMLQKRIPMQGGLGGGSADAAAALMAINSLCDDALTVSELCELGMHLGADVPFCIRGRYGAQTARGIGERMSPAPSLPLDWDLLVVLPGTAVSTPAAFHLLDEKYGQADMERRKEENERRYASHLAALERGCVADLAVSAFNRFEEAVFALQPATGAVFDRVRDLGADFIRMSGSGPTIIAGFIDRYRAEQAKAALLASGYPAYLCRGLSHA